MAVKKILGELHTIFVQLHCLYLIACIARMFAVKTLEGKS